MASITAPPERVSARAMPRLATKFRTTPLVYTRGVTPCPAMPNNTQAAYQETMPGPANPSREKPTAKARVPQRATTRPPNLSTSMPRGR